MTTAPVAYLLLEDARLPDEEALLRTLRNRHPELLWNSDGAAARSAIPGALSLRAGDQLMAIFLEPARANIDQQVWQRASWLWPEAHRTASRHRAHLVVVPIGPAGSNGEPNRVAFAETAQLLTALAGTVVAVLPGVVAVVWPGNIGRSPEMWHEMSQSAFAPYPDQPFALWMEIVPYRSGKTIGAYTIGLSPFIGREVEFEVDGLDQRTATARLAQLSAYLIGHGEEHAPQSGATYEADSEIDHRVAVLHRNSRFNIGPVISISSLDDRAGRSRIYPIIPAAIARNHPLLVALGKVRLFDPAQPQNQVRLKPDHYLSDDRLESFDQGVAQALSAMIATDAYAAADTHARRAIANGDLASARSILQPFADDVARFQRTAQFALTQCDLFMFEPAPPRSP